MNVQILCEARNYEDTVGEKIKKEERPDFHLSPRTGWMNDPNGFSFFDGRYHLFYQYYPYEPKWGPMHWGHAVSSDLLHWEYLPAALAPGEVYDEDGCISGSAIALPDGRQLLMYTGVAKEMQTQCLAVGNGLDYVKYEKNPVIDQKKLPEGCSKTDFRDPKIWRKSNGEYCCVVGNCTSDGDGHILLYASKDGFQWEFKRVLASNQNRFGKMWECPDFFCLNGKWVLLVSPQDMLPKDFEYHNGNGTLCLIGIDFYAPQTILTPDGRRVMIGWMQNWDTCNLRSPEELWMGQMSLPRELSIRNGRLYQQPIRELEKMRKNPVTHKNVVFSGCIHLDGISGRKIDMELTLRPGNVQEMYHKFTLWFAQNEQYHTSLSFRPKESILKIDRKFSGSRRAIIHQRRSRVRSTNGELKMRMILDRFSAEIFVNDGEQVMTATMYTEQEAEEITFFADGMVSMDILKYEL